MRVALLALALAACTPTRPPPLPSATLSEGLAISMYRDGARVLALVDDRRTVEVRGDELVIEPVTAGIELASLVVEPASAAGQGLVVDACRRASARATAIRCTARGARSPVFVRIVYVSSELVFAANHYVVVAGPRATINTTFSLELPTWGRRAVLALYEGIPGASRPPVQVGALVRDLDGSTATIEAAEREVAARRIVVFDPLREVEDDFRDDDLRADMRMFAWEWVELVDTTLPTGSVRLLVDVDSDDPVATDGETRQLVQVGTNLRVPLRPDEHVRGIRERHGSPGLDQFHVVLSNNDIKPRQVIVEEKLRVARRRTIDTSSPRAPVIVDDVARLELDVPSGGSVRARFSVRYEP
ncbi:MAG: hypothetical protein SFX73_08820 [Kofleriaceae bacterium]|nr:hypothetical protein [Kofleriaceae bacterium]